MLAIVYYVAKQRRSNVDEDLQRERKRNDRNEIADHIAHPTNGL